MVTQNSSAFGSLLAGAVALIFACGFTIWGLSYFLADETLHRGDSIAIMPSRLATEEILLPTWLFIAGALVLLTLFVGTFTLLVKRVK